MNSLKFSMARLLVGVAVVALGVMALVNASPLWVSVILTSIVVGLFFSACKAVTSRGPSAAFWTCFALGGWGYFLVIHGALLQPSVADSLLTSRSLSWIHSHIPTRQSLTVGSKVSAEWGQSWWPASIIDTKGGQYRIHYDDDPASTYDEWVGPARIQAARPSWEEFRQIGQAIWTVVVAYIAGLVGLWCSIRGGADASKEPPKAGAAND